MRILLSKELTEALHASGDHPLEAVDPETLRTYLIVDSEVHRRAMEALKRQQVREAIAEGLSELNSGQGKSIEEAFSDLRSRIGFPKSQ